MKRMIRVAIFVVFLIVVSTSAVILFGLRFGSPGTPPTLYEYTISPQNVQFSYVLQGITLQTTPGAELQINFTFMSTAPQKIMIPIENLALTAYNNNDNSADYSQSWDTRTWNTSLVQDRVFNYSFSLEEPSLQPDTSNSTVLTINVSNNAPLGRYALEVNLGSVRLVDANGVTETSYEERIWLGLIVSQNSS